MDGESGVCYICQAMGKIHGRILPVVLCKERACRNDALLIKNLERRVGDVADGVTCELCWEDACDIKFWVTLSRCGHSCCLACYARDAKNKLDNNLLTWDETTASFSMQCFKCDVFIADKRLLNLVRVAGDI